MAGTHGLGTITHHSITPSIGSYAITSNTPLTGDTLVFNNERYKTI